jgi:hypothetical protein
MFTAEPVHEPSKQVPSFIEIGLKASRKGNFQLARQMLHTAMEQLDGDEDKQPRLIELIVCIADTYLNEGSNDQAKAWYSKAFHRIELSQGANTFQAACLMTKLAEVSVLQDDMTEFQKCFENAQRAYLFSEETDTASLLGSLTDLSWALCVKQHLAEAQAVNSLISQIKELKEEDRLGIVAA